MASLSFSPPRTARSMVSLLSAREASAPLRITSSGGILVQAKGVAQGQLVLGEGAGFVRAKHVHARQFLDGHQLAHDRLFFGQQARATAMVTDNTVGMATGMAATVSTRANCRVARIGSPRRMATVMITATKTAARMIR